MNPIVACFGTAIILFVLGVDSGTATVAGVIAFLVAQNSGDEVTR